MEKIPLNLPWPRPGFSFRGIVQLLSRQGGPFLKEEALGIPGLIDQLQKLQAFTGSEFTANIDRDVIDRENFWHYFEKGRKFLPFVDLLYLRSLAYILYAILVNHL